MRRSILKVLSLLVSSGALAGCGPGFDPPHEVKSLRVLGIKKDKPYAQPGDTVELDMLWHDGSPAAGRPIVRAWFSGCVNPPGDLYQGCFAPLIAAANALDEGAPPPAGVGAGLGDTFSVTIPDDILSSRPALLDPSQPKHGLAYVFFVACAGELSFNRSAEGAFPLLCVDEDGTPLGSDDFVAGYTAIYSFAGFQNGNPAVTGFEFRGVAIEPDCIGAACLAAQPRAVDCAVPGDANRCVPSCAGDGDSGCDEHLVRAVVDPASAESDSVSAAIYDREVGEQMWINYYVDRGGLRSSVKLLNDATTGWNDENGTDFYAPREPGPVQVWAVVHDNRGGTEFARITIAVQ